MYPISVSDCPGPERGVFYILIVDIILRITLEGFNLLDEKNYYGRKVPACYVLTLYNECKYRDLSILFVFILSWDTSDKVHMLRL